MKNRLIFGLLASLTLTFSALKLSAQDTPAGIRMEIIDVEENDNHFSVFSYKDDDGTFGYYLGLGRVFRIMEFFYDDTENFSIDPFDETCMWLGVNRDEVLSSLNGILELFDKDLGTVVEFNGRAVTGSGRLSHSNKMVCFVEKKMLGGKQLRFVFSMGKKGAETYLSKSVVKQLIMGVKVDTKLHKDK